MKWGEAPVLRGVLLQTLSNRSFAVLDCVIARDRPVPDGRLPSRFADDLADRDSPAVGRPPATGRDLLELLAKVGDGRPGQGRDHPVAVLALAAAAVVAGSRSFTAVAGWAADVPADVLEDLYRRCGARRPGVPGRHPKATIWRVVTGADPAALRRGDRCLADGAGHRGRGASQGRPGQG
jgi:DDE_Tnp_1-associated